MKTKLWILILISGIVFYGCEKDDVSFNRSQGNNGKGNGRVIFTSDIDNTINNGTTGLIAGQNILVGNIAVDLCDDYIEVAYILTEPGWFLTETHLHIATDEAGIYEITNRGGNPIPGIFNYSGLHDNLREYTYKIDKNSIAGISDYYYIAAHAVVASGTVDLDAFAATLPETATISVMYPQSESDAYFPEVLISDAGLLDGTYKGWCIETDAVIFPIISYTANVFSSYSNDGSQVVHQPENLSMANWLINQDLIGQPSDCGGYFTLGDIQKAIWALIAEGNSNAVPTPFSDCRIGELKDMAMTNGEGFIPGCGDHIIVILEMGDPGNPVQNIIIEYPLTDCTGDGRAETAWGSGSLFSNNGNWAMWFRVCQN